MEIWINTPIQLHWILHLAKWYTCVYCNHEWHEAKEQCSRLCRKNTAMQKGLCTAVQLHWILHLAKWYTCVCCNHEWHEANEQYSHPCRKNTAMQEGLCTAVQVPLTVARISNSLWAPLTELAGIGNINCRSDLQVCQLFMLVCLLLIWKYSRDCHMWLSIGLSRKGHIWQGVF